MFAHCYYALSPGPDLDQTYSQKAIEAFQLFINQYPESGRVTECNEIIDQLRRKMALKAFNGAQLYFNLGQYKAAAVAFKNLLRKYPDIEEKEKVQFLIVKSYYLLADKSITEKKVERFETVIKSYYDFVDKYAESRYQREAENIYDASVKQLKKLKQNDKEKQP